MTNIEFRMFFDALPDKNELANGPEALAKNTFARECNIPLPNLKNIALGKMTFTPAIVNKLLPVMQKYGFQGN
ncbi:MAG: hypothetical protein V4714_08760 [Bacteroidota bacterium]